jgi:CRP-like cAMP-binding protein
MTTQRVRLLEVDPDLAQGLTPEEIVAAAAIHLPVRTVEHRGVDLMAELKEADAFAGLLLDGLLVHEISLGGRMGLRLLGPGDILGYDADLAPMILDRSRWRPAGPARVALFDHAMINAIGRWPRLMVALSMRSAQQVARLSAQLMICQLSRVEQRVLSLLWLLAESWGRVTASGTRLPLDLTHEAIGMMVGARRPTVSLALRELTEEGALVRQQGGWLLLRTPADTFTGETPPSASPAWAPEIGGDALPARRIEDHVIEQARLVRTFTKAG